MSHFVTVSDPWFGSYLWIRGTDGYSLVRPEVLIGPLYTRRFRSESLTNQGYRHKYRSLTEKPCQHGYVEGEISGTVDWTPYDGLFLGGPHSFTGQYISPDPEFEPIQVQIDCAVDWVESATSVAVSVKFVESLYAVPDPIFIQEYEIHLEGNIVDDPQTGARSYTGWREVSRTGSPLYPGTMSWSEGPAPFTEGVYSIGGSLPSIFQWVEGEFAKVATVKPGRTQRDKAIYEAIDDVSLSNINWIENANDVKNLLETLKGFLALFRPVLTPWDWLKKFANFWLFWQYVIKTTIMDVNDLIALIKLLKSNLGRLPELIRKSDMFGRGTCTETMTSGGCTTTLRCNTKVCYGPDVGSLDSFLSRLSLLHLAPKLEDLWDLIPYSFVVDWVIPVTDAINNLENTVNQQNLPLKYVVNSRKVTRDIQRSMTVGIHSFTVNLRFVRYERIVGTKLPSDMWLGVNFRDPRKHALTAAALLIQRL